ncbi:hypothetical protein Pcinc_044191 [Petrolisthes cinctipes]|uniref:Uncharacterized protein n=1 Tax=Petrolisthes cinctipes TaxID=88211 RepID=A0AAE1BHL1_PETCI|nr:hypothetical protein Pcinc_044191 [Petrolisthes cinctipes]
MGVGGGGARNIELGGYLGRKREKEKKCGSGREKEEWRQDLERRNGRDVGGGRFQEQYGRGRLQVQHRSGSSAKVLREGIVFKSTQSLRNYSTSLPSLTPTSSSPPPPNRDKIIHRHTRSLTSKPSTNRKNL